MAHFPNFGGKKSFSKKSGCQTQLHHGFWHPGKIQRYQICITVSMQKITSIHKLIQQILGCHELNDDAHFWPDPPKNHWNNFLLSWICTAMQKISSFDQFIVEIQPVLWPDWPHPFLAMPIQKIFDQLLIYVNLY